jgi:hypothetical protein
MTTSLTFDRTSLSLSPLIVGLFTPSATYFLPEDGITWPAFTMRRTYAPDGDVPGKQKLAAVPDQGPCQVAVYVQSDTTANLHAAMDALDAAATQWSYDLTITDNGVARTYQADPEFPQWGQLETAMSLGVLARATITIPVNPV